jgi:hypothetical protein
VDDFVCLTLLSGAGEEQAAFSARLSRFWTHLLRTRPEDFEQVYAEATRFEQHDGGLARQYLVREAVLGILEQELAAAGLTHEPVDRADTFTKYEAVAPEWMQIEH